MTSGFLSEYYALELAYDGHVEDIPDEQLEALRTRYMDELSDISKEPKPHVKKKPSDSKRALAENIGKNMYASGMTHARYAKHIGIPISTLEYVISGKGSVSINTLDKIARGTGIDPWELIKP